MAQEKMNFDALEKQLEKYELKQALETMLKLTLKEFLNTFHKETEIYREKLFNELKEAHTNLTKKLENRVSGDHPKPGGIEKIQ